MTSFSRELAVALSRGTALFLGLVLVFMAAEPVVTRAVTDDFTVSQSVTAEIAFDATAADVTMGPTIPGLTGGTANGSTDVRVVTNNPAGYAMSIAFSTSTAMQGAAFGGEIANYTPTVSTTPDFIHSVGANTGEFAYSVEGEFPADIDQTFLDDGANCGTGSLNTADSCWFSPSDAEETIINRTTFTDSDGASTTVKFRVQLTSNPNPIIPADTYTATATLTALMN